jgi:hypothetical protein
LKSLKKSPNTVKYDQKRQCAMPGMRMPGCGCRKTFFDESDYWHLSLLIMSGFATSGNELAEVRRSTLHADGVFMTTSVAAGTLAFAEAPLNKLQSLDNRQEVACCGQCLRFLGGSKLQLALLTGSSPRAEVAAHMGAGTWSTGAEEEAAVHLCRDGCGEMYCSPACAAAHWNASHCLLCTGKIPDSEAETHPLMAFKTHACGTNEIFLMVADIFAGVVVAVDAGRTVEEALRPYEGYVREQWWDAVADPDPVLHTKLKELVAQSWFLLDRALSLTERGLGMTLSIDYFSQTVGMFEQNNVGVQLSSPLAELARSSEEQSQAEPAAVLTHTLLLGAAKTILLQSGGQCTDEDCMDEEEEGWGEGEEEEKEEGDEEAEEEEGPLQDEDIEAATSVAALVDAVGGDDALWTPLSGAAFYSKICKINHSCEPNVMVTYACTHTQGVVAQVEVLRDLTAGDELLHSYVDRHDDYQARTAAIAEYGFTCACIKCAAERLTLS